MSDNPGSRPAARSELIFGSAVIAIICLGISCKAGDLRTSTKFPNKTSEGIKTQASSSPKPNTPGLEAELTGVNIVQTGYLFSIVNPKAANEKCWYLAEQWGQNFGGATTAKSLQNLRPLTVKSISTEAVKKAVNENTTRETGIRDTARYVLAGCGAATPFAAKTLVGAVALAICGAGGTLAEKAVGDKIASADQARDVAAGKANIGSKTDEKLIIEIFEASLRGKVGDGSMNCAQALTAAKAKESAKK
jgi:hypothetical protein